MPGLVEVDSVEVLVLVDNTTDSLSTTPGSVETEFARLRRRGIDLVAGTGLAHAAHGLACLVTVRHQGAARSALFDAGPSGDVFASNVQRLGVDLGAVEAVVLSHGHWDHAGGLLRALDLIRVGGRAEATPCFAHPGMFHQRASRRSDGTFRLMEDVPSPRLLEQHGAEPVLTTEPQLALDAQLFVSGEIPRVTPFETGLPGQHRRRDEGDAWEPDELVVDERFVAVKVKGRGLVVLSACSHAGVVNVLAHARDTFPDTPLHAVLGGLHLAGTNERIIPSTIAELATFDLATIAPGHCTGWRATARLLHEFGDDRLVPLAVGKRLTF